MNKVTLYLFFLFILLNKLISQNTIEYVTNGSFEEYDSCHQEISLIGVSDNFKDSGVQGWSCPIASSSDFFCPNSYIANWPPSIPGFGYQYPKTGFCMAGFYVGYGVNYANYREYVQNKLSHVLRANTSYDIEFYLSKGSLPCTTSDIGIKFFDQQYNDTTKFWLTELTPDAENPPANFIIDTLGWQKINLRYVASGNENFMVIGCFTDSLKLTIDCDTTGMGINYSVGVGYFFIDDVSIKESDIKSTCNILIPEVVTANNDGLNDIFKFEICENLKKFQIFNRWGSEVFNGRQGLYWHGQNYNNEELPVGTYYYLIETEIKNYRGFVQLVR